MLNQVAHQLRGGEQEFVAAVVIGCHGCDLIGFNWSLTPITAASRKSRLNLTWRQKQYGTIAALRSQ